MQLATNLGLRTHATRGKRSNRYRPFCFCSFLVLLAPSIATPAAPPLGTWQAQGPAPTLDGQVEGIDRGEVAGAIHAVVAHPTDPGILYVGAVNGGIWKTVDATAPSPHWVQLAVGHGEPVGSLAISALELDPTDPSHKTLVAGTGSYSSFGATGGPRIGLLRTTDAGASWAQIRGVGASDGILVGKRISGVAARGSTLVVAVDSAFPNNSTSRGIWRSTDGGDSWIRVSTGTGARTGLPGGLADDLVGDPSDSSRLYTSVIYAEQEGGSNGLYRSDDTGASWARVSSPAIDALLDPSSSVSNVEFAVAPSGTVFVAIATDGRLAGLFRSADRGASWAALDLPGNGISIHVGGQANLHMSIAADPTDDQLVYLGGDRQNSPFPNQIGAFDFTGRLFRCDASRATGAQCVHITHSARLGPAGGGTASSSAPHADSRDMTFDAAGNLLQVDDGGIYLRTAPRSSAGDWFSRIGNLQVTEVHSAAYDAVSSVVLAGAQDTGTPYQLEPGADPWQSLSTGDGGKVVVDDRAVDDRAVDDRAGDDRAGDDRVVLEGVAGPVSIRYSSFQGLGAFRRSTFDAANRELSSTFPALTLTTVGGNPLVGQFYTPIALHAVDPNRLLFGAGSVYESLDQGDTIEEIGVGIRINGTFYEPIVYGAAGQPELLVIGVGSEVLVRTAAAPAPLVSSRAYPGTGTVRALAIDPADPNALFSVEADAVYATSTQGDEWTAITGNIARFEPGQLRSAAFVPAVRAPSEADGLFVGADRGVYAAFRGSGFADWQLVGRDLPPAPVFELEYDPVADLLLAALLGRGAWTLEKPALAAAGGIHADGFESGDLSAWTALRSTGHRARTGR